MKLHYGKVFKIKPIVEGVLYYYVNPHERNILTRCRKNEYEEIVVLFYAGGKFSHDFLSDMNKVKKNLEPIYKIYIANKTTYSYLPRKISNIIRNYSSLSFHISSSNFTEFADSEESFAAHYDMHKAKIMRKLNNIAYYDEKYNVNMIQRVCNKEVNPFKNVITYLTAISAKYKFIEDFLFYSRLTDLHHHFSFSRGWRIFRNLFLRKWFSYVIYVILLLGVVLDWSQLLHKYFVTSGFIQHLPERVRWVVTFLLGKKDVFSGSHWIILYLLASILGIYFVYGIKNARHAEVRKVKLLFFENTQKTIHYDSTSGDFIYLRRGTGSEQDQNKNQIKYENSIVDLLKDYEEDLTHLLIKTNNDNDDELHARIYNTLLDEVVREFLSASEKLPIINI